MTKNNSQRNRKDMSIQQTADYQTIRLREMSWIDNSGNVPPKNSILASGVDKYNLDRAYWTYDISVNSLLLSGGCQLTCSGDTLLVNNTPVGGTGGSTGTTGKAGSTGPSGQLGPIGNSPNGITGETGVAGPSGLTGNPGSPGLIGNSGSTGPLGIKGASGGIGLGSVIYGELCDTLLSNTSLTFNPTLGPAGIYFITVAVDISGNYGFRVPKPTPPAISSSATFSVIYFNFATLSLEAPFNTIYYNSDTDNDSALQFGAVSTSFFSSESPLIVVGISTVVDYPVGEEPTIRLRYKCVQIG